MEEIKITSKIILVFIIILKSLNLGEASEICQKFSSHKDFLNFFIENHPETKSQKLKINESLDKIKVAEQKINPELQLGTQTGKSSNESTINIEASYQHTFELGNKREARVSLAKTESDEVSISQRNIQENIYIEASLNFYKFKNFLEQEILYNEVIETFRNIINQYNKRQNLNPEQQVSLTTFQVALQEYILKKDVILNEISELNNYFQIVLGDQCKIGQAIQIKEISNWPKLNLQNSYISNDYSEINRSLTNIKVKESLLAVEKSNSVPNLKIGPTLSAGFSKGENDYAAGISITMDLPILNKNQGGKALASSSLIRANQDNIYIKDKILLEKKKWISIYENSIEGIKNAQSMGNLTSKHKKTDRLFKEGIISSSLILELHRQLIDFTVSKQEQQMSALKALLSIYAIDGKLLELDVSEL